MIFLKSQSEIELMKIGGFKLANTLKKLLFSLKPGINLLELEKMAVRLIKEYGGEPAFQRVPNYFWATCLNVNEGIVHGIPRSYIVKANDVVNVDIGMYYQGFNTDMSFTKSFLPNKEIDNFLSAGKEALKQAIKVAIPGNRVGHISQKIAEIVRGNGYYPVSGLTGHGVGVEIHEPPSIPCFLDRKIEDTPILEKGMTLAIEVIYTMKKGMLKTDEQNKWTIQAVGSRAAAVFEQSIALTEGEPLLLTPFF